MLKSLLLVLLVAFTYTVTAIKTVSTDRKGWIIDGKRELLISGSFHYPRSSAQEWKKILQSMKDQGINTLQTYVMWDIHEKNQGHLEFTNMENDNEDLIKFLKTAQDLGLYINLRFGPYVCAEWNYGGIPVWVRELSNPNEKNGKITFRTDDDVWMQKMLTFIDAALESVKSNGLMAGTSSDGNIIMLQIENEYGNVQKFYGHKGAEYVKLLADYVHTKNEATVPWIMCQQGEGKGTSPPADIINTCNGFYCDSWIPSHAEAFENQPHMFTELWPGWYQKWGEGVPHRPAVDVAYSVMRWFAAGGSFVNYYMAFGGTSFARTVGGPNIVTSYDYDVAINEYGEHSEPKYSLLQSMHKSLYAVQHTIFADESKSIPKVELFGNSTTACESRTYIDSSEDGSCAIFLSNTGSSESCQWNKVEVPSWSVSLLKGNSNNCNGDTVNEIFNTKKGLLDVPAPNKQTFSIVETTFIEGKSLREKIPSSGRLSGHFSHMTLVPILVANEPIQQLDFTHDKTDYAWYSHVIDAPTDSDKDKLKISRKEHKELKFNVGTGAGAYCRVWINQEENLSGEKAVPPVEVQMHVTYRYHVKLRKNLPNTIDIMCSGAGLQNYGPYMERIETGIVGDVKLDDETLVGWKHSNGLLGEAINYGDVSKISQVIDPMKRSELIDELEGHGDCNDMCWRQFTLTPANIIDTTASYAIDLLGLGKGHIWVNGKMLGRYWDQVAREYKNGACTPCDEGSYVGEYHQTSCRSGCGEVSQRYYKIPTDWLNNGDNKLILFEEKSGKSRAIDCIKLVQMIMKPLN